MEEHEKPRLARLTDMVTLLQSKRVVTARTLAEKYGVSIRTVYRDIRTLEQSGIPIVTEEGKGYSLMEGYQLPPVLFTEEEANALITAEQLVLKSKDQSFSEHFSHAVAKIKSVLRHSQKGKAELLAERIYIGENQQQETTSDYLMRIQMALTHYQVITIAYESSEKKTSERVIEPFALYNNRGNWLLVAFCRLREDFRVFRIDYIQSLSVQKETFTPHEMTFKEYFEKYVKDAPYL
ncbi:MAG TPA: DNA-binding transcriptional regulator [Cytophagales bacterium]|nr:DNA-binding transcriptional regulator [Cytophagales bacterium]HAA22692.1 DNA-binding transcriptional regulator [Cytophagales bacterium]HAP59494.1 DNA-binding transcriptional regulator [Cytophagales bacterium]